MGNSFEHIDERELDRQRQAVRRDLLRVQRTLALILAVVIALALAAIFQAWRAERKSAEAESASLRAQEELWHSRLLQAESGRVSGRIGRRRECLGAIAAAAALKPTLELRNEAIAAMVMTDLEETTQWCRLPALPVRRAFGVSAGGFALADAAGQVVLGKVSGGTEALDVGGAGDAIESLARSPDGRWLALVHASGRLQVWDAPARVLAFSRDRALAPAWPACHFSPEGDLLAVCAPDRQVRFLRSASGDPAAAPLSLEGDPLGLQLSPDGRLLVVWFGGLKHFEVWDWRAGKLVFSQALPASISCMAWNSDSARLAAGGADGDSYLVDIRTGQRRELHGHADNVERVGFQPGTDLLFTVSWDGTARFWDAGSGETLFTMTSSVPWGFTEDGERLIAFDRAREQIVAWTVQNGTGYVLLRGPMGPRKSAWATDFSPDGAMLAAGTDQGIELWSVSQRKLLAALPVGFTTSLAFDASGGRLISSGPTGLRLWQVEGGGAGLHDPVVLPTSGPTPPPCAAWASGDREILTIGWDRATLIDVANSKARAEIATPPGQNSGSLDRHGRWLATGTWLGDGTRVWNMASGTLERTLGTTDAYVAFTPDGGALISGGALEYQCWNVDTWTRRWRIARTGLGANAGPIGIGLEHSLLALAVSPGLVQLADSQSGEALANLASPPSKQIHCFGFSRTANRLVVGTGNGFMELWDLPAIRAELARLNLDWGTAAPRAPEPVRSPAQPSSYLFATTSAGVLLALVLFLGGTLRHRQLAASYEHIENMARERGRNLAAAQTEILLSHKMKALGTLAAGIAHDFNNLLSVIRMAGKSIGRRTAGDPEIGQDLADIEETVLQGKEVVRSMLGYSRETPGEATSCRAPEVIRDTIALLSKPFLGGIELVLDLGEEVRPTGVSRARLGQVLLNLIVNAAEAMQGRGRLTLSLRAWAPRPGASYVLRPRAAAGYTEMKVSDTGSGIPPELLDRIFEPFFTTKQAGAARGTGLGLSVVYTLAQQEGLGLCVTTSRDAGTTFTVILPQTPP